MKAADLAVQETLTHGSSMRAGFLISEATSLLGQVHLAVQRGRDLEQYGATSLERDFGSSLLLSIRR